MFTSLPKHLWFGALLLGLGFRVTPLFDRNRLLSQWPTEDGYFMLTMARNLALGRGLSVAGGEMPTNGTQPLTTLLWAGMYSLFGTDVGGLLAVQVLSVLIAGATALTIFQLSRRLDPTPEADRRGLIAAALWFLSPVVMPHTMNCLETGLYALMASLVALVLVAAKKDPGEWSLPRTAAFGVLLGAAFWTRNDAAFLIAACCLYVLWPALRAGSQAWPALRGRLTRVVLFGGVSVLVASPWLLFNLTRFGHLMPVSGRAESLTGTFASNLPALAVPLLEYSGLLLPIPHAMANRPLVVIVAWVLLLGLLAGVVGARSRLGAGQARLLALTGVYGAGLALFYGLFFGAPWFLSRYFLPLSPLVAVLLVAFVADGVSVPWMTTRSVFRRAQPALAALALLAAVGVSARHYARGDRHAHFHVVEWVRTHVPADTWVGAIQTGTLGYFHERTVNLDGKVNLAAYEALRERREGEYVAYETQIEYLVDWIGMRDWLTKPAIAENFELLEAAEEENLAVLRRKPPATLVDGR
jgi:hypothetical protein